jgi:ankyrin repeat protein
LDLNEIKIISKIFHFLFFQNLHEAILVLCKKGDVDGMKSLIFKLNAEAVVGEKSKIEIDSWDKMKSGGTTGLHVAAEAGKTQMVSFLLENGADPDVKDASHQSPLKLAFQNGHVDALRLLLEKPKVNMNIFWKLDEERK